MLLPQLAHEPLSIDFNHFCPGLPLLTFPPIPQSTSLSILPGGPGVGTILVTIDTSDTTSVTYGTVRSAPFSSVAYIPLVITGPAPSTVCVLSKWARLSPDLANI